MRWEQVCADASLQNLPYKIELDAQGKIIMSPAKNKHSVTQGEFQNRLYELLGKRGKIIPECAVQTAEGVKVADVAWISPARYQQVKTQIAYTLAPELCIEIRSSANTDWEMRNKIRLYLNTGAEEVWICDEDGKVQFYDKKGEMNSSRLVSGFPKQVQVE